MPVRVRVCVQGHEGDVHLQAMELTDHAYRKLEGMLKDQDPELQFVGETIVRLHTYMVFEVCVSVH
eukprot:54453-Eustigmatos_ZCMA.PRE.1